MGSYDADSDVNYMYNEPIAIVGSSCRFPGGATSPSKLWELLKQPRDVLQSIPSTRFSTKAFHNSNSQHHGSMNVEHAYLLQEDPRMFDRDFFSINPKEAEAMDPQQRSLLETVYEGVESTGYTMQQLRGSRTAVFVGCMSYDYHFTAIRGIDSLPQYHATGTAASILSNRVSYFYDWRGPSVTIDTACSSSLVAVHQAVSALRNGDANMAVAAGSNLILGPEPFVSESKLNMLSPNGRSWMWDASADGYTRGEGFGAVFLKTLRQAIADGDHVEAIIRETGVNSDGKTPGITMPSSDSQAQLIRDTYARAGLDPTRASDRPQFFEAHGTGTQAGDPIEARAIHSVFFPNKGDGNLLVGSIKTVIGHTEGTAGIAGILKASLAVQHAQIPANLHFKNLNSKIEPYYTNLRIPTEMVAWPDVPHGGPRRVSVNSFGFGGTNAHAIIESFERIPRTTDGLVALEAPQSQFPGPFVLSASSGPALSASAGALATYLRAQPDTDLDRLAYTLFRKADFPVRAAFSATSVSQLADKLDQGKDALKNNSRNPIIPELLPVRILGVFTGQGAQWATMGRELFQSSNVFRRSIELMQASLDTLPIEDQPDWTLADQMNAPAESSRVGEAIVSQPLCTALQIALVDVLRVAEIKLSAVVGHSSGEIGAAYAAGYLTAADAIRIAYYRGFHAHLAQGPEGKRGKMMAVGMSLEQAKVFCAGFDGGLTVAASNSQTSCTLAGDAEAIDTASAQLQESGTFARVLQVDTAYHSHHMNACAEPYLRSMKQCGVQVQPGNNSCRWYSSVWGLEGRKRPFRSTSNHVLEGEYWVQNMTGAVLFDQAVARALNEDQYMDVVLEVGPHPALKGPASETIKSQTETSLPYFGLLKRGQSDVESFANTLGLLWQHFPSVRPILRFDTVQRALCNGKPPKSSLLKSLPAYSWDRPGLIWKESRASRVFRTQSQSRHELLGHVVTHGEREKRETHWKQVLRLNELPWLAGHKIQGEVLFPASGYLSMAYEAAIRLTDDQTSLRLVELHDIDIVRAMRLEEDSSGLEVVFTTRVTSQSDECITAEVSCYSGAVDTSQPLDTSVANLTAHFTGHVRLWLGHADENVLPKHVDSLLPLDELSMERLYASLSKEGFNYEGHFRAKAMVRRLNQAVVTLASAPEESSIRSCVHPTVVDTAFQGLLAAFAYPEDGRMGSIYLPTHVDCIRINMAPSKPNTSGLRADVTVSASDKSGLTGDLDLFDSSNATEVQIRGVHLTPVGQPRDPWLYAGVKWEQDASCGILPSETSRLTDDEHLLYERLVRTAYFYIRQLRKKILPQELLLMGKYRKHMMTWVTTHLLPQIEAGNIPDIKPEWKNDTLDMITQWRASYPPDNNDMNILHAMGKNLVQIVRGTIPPLRVLTQDSMLDRLYVEGIGVKHGNVDLGLIVQQLAHQYPQMKVVEVGAGTGGTTRTMLDSLGNHFMSYTYTDISTGFFEIARSKFAQHLNKVNFKTLNIENDPVEQGFADGTFDMVVSSNCLHATKCLGQTLAHCRKLLRPGGRLVLLEVTKDFLSTQLIMSTLPGWFLGIEDGRVWAPTVSVERWDELLRENGFSGVDISSSPSYCSVIVAQAVDPTIDSLRRPLDAASNPAVPRNIIIVGSGASSELATQMQSVFLAAPSTTNTNVTVISSLEGIQIPSGTAVLSLQDLDKPIFTHMTADKFKGLQETMANADSVLWVTAGAKSGKNPDANLTPGLSTALLAEHRNLKLQFLDVDDPSSVDPRTVAEMLLRLAIHDPTKADNILWNQEPELALKENALYIPRYQALDPINRRSAARLRQVTQTVDLKSNAAAIEIRESQGSFEVQTGSKDIAMNNNTVALNIITSCLQAIIVEGVGEKYLCVGRDTVTQDKVFALTDVLSPVVEVPSGLVLRRWQDEKAASEDATSLSQFMGRVVAEHVLSDLKGPIWIHGAPKDVSDAIRVAAVEKAIEVFQTTSEVNEHAESTFIHPYAGQDDVQKLIPRGLVTFINGSNSSTSALLRLITKSLPRSVSVKEGLYGRATHLKRETLSHLAEASLTDHPKYISERNAIPADEIATLKQRHVTPTAVVDWATIDTLNAAVRPLNHANLFSPNKTYLLCGMTGDLGISVSLWMVHNGAKNIVLTSRNPNIPQTVLEVFSQKGANIRPMAVDLTNMDSLQKAYNEIKASMPAVGGVMNAAMVLRDRLFQTLPWEDFSAVLAPKVTGSRNLDKLFGDEALDFFICFSSTTSIVGSIGQSAYAAANHYMSSLVHGRHGRGLAGSVIYISILTGFGYIFRRQAEHADTIYKSILPRCERQSETDLHEMLAEAIVCGRPGPTQMAELITGIRPVFTEEWRDDPRLACYKNQRQLDEAGAGASALDTLSVKEQLAACEEPAECLGVLLQCFGIALGNLLELDPEQLDVNTPVVMLGIDSLIAIRIREWFLRELGVDVPVLKVMSDNYSMSRLCDDILVDWRRINKA